MSSPGDDIDDASPCVFSPACRRKGELITTVIVWMLLGAMVNIAVAWGLTWRVTLDWGELGPGRR